MGIELIIAILGIIVAVIIGAWQIFLSYKQKQTVHAKDQKLVDSFALGYSLIGAIAAVNNPALSAQRDTCLHGLKQASEKLGIKTSSIVKRAISIDGFLSDGKDILLLRDKLRKKYGKKASEAVEVAIWLAVSPLSDDQGREKAISHAEKLAETIGLDKAYISHLFTEARKMSDHLQFASKVPQFLMETMKQLEAIEGKAV